MSTGQERHIWFLEPSKEDRTLRQRRQSMTSWLKRSTHPKAVAFRRFPNDNLAEVPRDSQAQFVRRLRDDWDSGLFELIVARTLQVLGADITIEVQGVSGVPAIMGG